jgi:L-lactate permease
MEFNLFIWVLSILPIVLLLFLMAKVKMSSKNAAVLSLILTVLIAVYFYKINFYNFL